MSMNPFGNWGANPGQPSPQPQQGYDASGVPFTAAQQRDRNAFFVPGQQTEVPPEAYQTPQIPGANPQPPQPRVGQAGIDRLIPAVSDEQTRVYQAMLGMTVPGPLPDALVKAHQHFKRFHDKVGPATDKFAPVGSATVMFLAKIQMDIAELQQAAQTLAKMCAATNAAVNSGAVGLKSNAPAPAPTPVAPPAPSSSPLPQAPAGSSPPAPEVTTDVQVDAGAPALSPPAPEAGSLCLADGTIIAPGNFVEAKWRGKGKHRVAQFIKVDDVDEALCILNFNGKAERVPCDRVKKFDGVEEPKK